MINGKQRAHYYRREQSLISREKRLVNKLYAVIVRNEKETQHVANSYVMPIPEDVNKRGTLHIEQLLKDCCNLTLVDSQLLPLVYSQINLDPAMFANTVSFIILEA